MSIDTTYNAREGEREPTPIGLTKASYWADLMSELDDALREGQISEEDARLLREMSAAEALLVLGPPARHDSLRETLVRHSAERAQRLAKPQPRLQHSHDLVPAIPPTKLSPEAIEVHRFLDDVDLLQVYEKWIGKMVKGSRNRTEVPVSCPIPAHLDNNPSASINVEQKVWYCHACCRGGDIYDLGAIYFGFGLDTYKTDGTFPDLTRRMAADLGWTPRHAPLATKGPASSAHSTSMRSVAPVDSGRPRIARAALHGLAGEIVEATGPYSEADPVAILLSFLVAFGAAVGPLPYSEAGDARQAAHLFAVLVGDSGRARKGTSWKVVEKIMSLADHEFLRNRVLSGFGSGEAVVDEVADAPAGLEDQRDPRLLVQEAEFAVLLMVSRREGSILSTTMRNAFDGVRLQVRSRVKRAVATDHHIAVLGHITQRELKGQLREVEMANGFGNRFLFAWVSRSKELPFGGNTPDHVVQELAEKVRARLAVARSRGPHSYDWADDARDRWSDIYHDVGGDSPGGLLEALITRAETHLRRLALTYALLDEADSLALCHLEAALAVWNYCRSSAAYIFGHNLGYPLADELLKIIRATGPSGISFTEQSNHFSRKKNAAELDHARTYLEQLGKIENFLVKTAGRTANHSKATEPPQ